MDYRRALGINTSNTSNIAKSSTKSDLPTRVENNAVLAKPLSLQEVDKLAQRDAMFRNQIATQQKSEQKMEAANRAQHGNNRKLKTQSNTTAPQPYHIEEKMIDIGANLASKRFEKNTAQVLERAEKANLSHVIITGTDVAASRRAEEMCKEHANKGAEIILKSTAGIHPHNAGKARAQDMRILAEMSRSDHVVAVGECGLDYNRMFSSEQSQKKVFREQMDLARETKLPVFLHERDAFDDFIEIIKEYPDVKKVVHCYTDPNPHHLDALLRENCYIGITGWVTDERRGKALSAIVNKIPMEKLMIETDAPYLTPQNMEFVVKENEPYLLGYVAKKLSECYGTTDVEIARKTTENAKQFFSL